MNKGLPIDEYNINVKVNGVNVPNISAGDGKISTESISIADEKYGMNGGNAEWFWKSMRTKNLRVIGLHEKI